MKAGFNFKHPRFRRTNLCLTEWVELYRPGGYHLVVVIVGDEFQDGRYRVTSRGSPGPGGGVRFLDGGLCVVRVGPRATPHPYVALKFLASSSSSSAPELEIQAASPLQASTEAKRVLKQVLGGLAFLHARGVVHAGLGMRAVGFLTGERLAGVEEWRVMQRKGPDGEGGWEEAGEGAPR
ncbi:hypothetical protein LZ554_008484 [Drepanopeziza brunnea f. sp. 'monogermtubi']|nr:hypothetical protein LZ554_008484 [Drepanopeziza brunnea f. sp. 'monogermtubi']